LSTIIVDIVHMVLISLHLKSQLHAKGIGVHYPLAPATDDLNKEFGGIEGLPTTMLYDRQGTLRMKVIGFEYTDNIESALKALL
jgi:hypothetical protein